MWRNDRQRSPGELSQQVIEVLVHDWAHLDDTIKSRWRTRSPGERGIEIDDVDDVKPGELFLRVGVGAVQHPGHAIRDSHSPRRRGRLEAGVEALDQPPGA